MLVGYARVSTAEQNPDHQTDALLRAGVAQDDVHVDHASGAKASRPKLDLVLQLLRDGDVLVVTRLDRLGRSVLHLVTLGAQLRERGVGLQVVEQGIDTATAEGRAMFGMLSVLAELQRELIVANTATDSRPLGRAVGAVDDPPNLAPTRSPSPNASMTPGSTPSPRSPPCSPFPAAPSTATSTRPPSGPGPAPRRQLHRRRLLRSPRPALNSPSKGTPVRPRQHPEHPGLARDAGMSPEHGRKPPRSAPTWRSPGSAPTPAALGKSSPAGTATAVNPTDPWSTSRVRCAVMD